MDVKGKTAIITGSNSGIGLGVARELAKAGLNVVLNSFTDTDDDHAIAKEIADEFGVTARYIQADMSKADQCRALVETAGVCDILVNNAGIQYVAGIDEFPVEKWDAIIAINMSSAFHTTAAALPMMRKAGWGRVINIASAHGLTASPYKSAYVAAKHGVVGLTKVTALETAREPITANAICPGVCFDPLGRKTDPRHDEEIRYGPRNGYSRGLAGAPTVQGIRHRRTAWRDMSVPRLRRGRTDHRHHDFRRWRMDRTMIDNANKDHPPRKKLRPLVLEDASHEGSKFTRCNLTHTLVINCNLSGVVLDDCNIANMSVHNANLTNARIENANYTGATITNANLADVTIENCSLEGMTINGILVEDLLRKWQDG